MNTPAASSSKTMLASVWCATMAQKMQSSTTAVASSVMCLIVSVHPDRCQRVVPKPDPTARSSACQFGSRHVDDLSKLGVLDVAAPDERGVSISGGLEPDV